MIALLALACLILCDVEAIGIPPDQNLCPNETSWMPSCWSKYRDNPMGPRSFGVWTQQWKETEGELPFGLTVRVFQNPYFAHHISENNCPYGRALPGEVTWPSPPADLKEYVSNLDALKVLCVFWSYTPFLAAARVILDVLWTLLIGSHFDKPYRERYITTRQVSTLLFLIFMLSVGNAMKYWLAHPRPGTLLQVKDYAGKYVGSCIPSAGMPSSNSLVAMGWFVLIFLDARDRKDPVYTKKDSGCFRNILKFFINDFSLKPWPLNQGLNTPTFTLYVSVWGFFMMPVPLARMYLYDNTPMQCFAGMLVGAVLANMWWSLVCHLQKRWERYQRKRVTLRELLGHSRGSGEPILPLAEGQPSKEQNGGWILHDLNLPCGWLAEIERHVWKDRTEEGKTFSLELRSQHGEEQDLHIQHHGTQQWTWNNSNPTGKLCYVLRTHWPDNERKVTQKIGLLHLDQDKPSKQQFEWFSYNKNTGVSVWDHADVSTLA